MSMNRRFLFGFLTAGLVCVSASCGGGHPTHSLVTGTDPSDPWRDTGLATITGEEVTAHLALLASTEYGGRGSGTTEEPATAHIVAEFTRYGLRPAFGDDYRQKFSVSRGRGHTWNVAGILDGNDPILKDEVVVVGAHYDHLGRSGSSVYYGADDNASGTAAILEVAQALSAVRAELRRTVLVIAFSGEELGLIGSSHYVRNPALPLNRTVAMINLDMVGWLRNKRLSFLGGAASSRIRNLISSVAPSYPGISPNITSSAGGGSDHVPFIRAGVPGVFLHTGGTDVYHTPRDTPDRINYSGLTDVVRFTYEMAGYLAIDTARPVIDGTLILDDDALTHDHGGQRFPKP